MPFSGTLALWTGITVLFSVLLLRFFFPEFLRKHVGKIFAIIASLTLFEGLFLSFLQYKVWSMSAVGQYFLPPYQPDGFFGGYDYFLFYVFLRYVSAPFLGILCGLSFAYGARVLNRKSAGRFFEDEEPWLCALGVALSGYPGFLFYMPIVLGAAIGAAFACTIFRKGSRMPLYHLWIPCAILAILIVHWALPKSFLALFNI